jgi:hypothetical protein
MSVLAQPINYEEKGLKGNPPENQKDANGQLLKSGVAIHPSTALSNQAKSTVRIISMSASLLHIMEPSMLQVI